MDRHAINFAWLIRLRWGALLGQVITIAAVDRLMHIPLPMAPLVVLLAAELASNLACAAWAARRPRVREAHVAAVMALDVVILTGLLYVTGGAFNPFSFLYLVHLALAAIVLRAAWTWALFALSLACFGSLFTRSVWGALDVSTIDLHMHHMGMHVEGMGVALAVAGAFIIYFVSRISRALAARDAELAAARAAAERQTRLASLATLATGAAHELATPLSTIATAAKELERALDARGDADAREDARLIREQVDRCRFILDQLAADAGHSAGDGTVDVSLESLVRGSLDGLDGGRVRVDGDPAALARTLRVPVRPATQALRGVLKNALDATDGGAVEVRCRVDAAAVRVEVRDAGPGMAPDVLARAGEPFFTTKQPGRGMGLGLFLTRTVLDHLGGSLRLDSTPGRGTSAELTFPAGGGRQPVTDPRRPSILIVDDDEPFRLRLARAFRDRGYDATAAAGHDEALAAARLDSPELAVLDLKMPGRSGLELARDLQEIDPTTRIVILTGYGSIATAVEAMRLGVAWYLPKPADADDIIAAFTRSEEPPLAAAPAATPTPSLERAKWEHIQRVLSDCGGNISEAARRLGMHRRSLQRMLDRNPPRQ